MKNKFSLPVAKILVVLAGFLINYSTFAQCPVANSCSPSAAPSSNFPFGMGIYNVAIGGGATGFANPTIVGASDGYKDYSCTKKAIVKEGVATAISVTTNPNSDENVRVWIDLNNNGTFESASELVFTSNNARQHTGSFAIPVSATVVKNTILRMRISSDDNGSPILAPCSTPKFGQVEDYGITVIANTSKPAVDFSANKPVTCSPTVQFTDLTQNGATSYLWSFGDNTTSTAPSPAHTYAATGTYTIKLKACNANGCDSLTKINYVTYHNNVPIAASCTPTTINYCCGFGITKITFGSMVNTSQDGAAGYENFTCTKSVTVEEGQAYLIALETSSANNQDTWVYIDYNNNGSFEASELVSNMLNYRSPTGTISIPAGKTLNMPLRMRIISDAQGAQAGACVNRISGQVEDYTLIITRPPVSIASNYTNTCQSQVQFTANSNFSATSWAWDFGDGTTSSQQNPVHNFSGSGVYTVKLKACNGAACDSVTKVNYIAITSPCKTYCQPTVPNTNINIRQVKLNTLNNITGFETNGYGNYSTLATSLTKGGYYPLNIAINYWGTKPLRVVTWIDYNQDGDFNDTGEEVANVQSSKLSKIIYIPSTVSSGVTRMRVLIQSDSVTVNSCATNLQQGEIEDYSIEIKPVTSKPGAYFNSLENLCASKTVVFADSSSNLPATYRWNFGDAASGSANVSSLRAPTHTFSSPGNYSVKLIACNSFGCDSLQKTINVLNSSSTMPNPSACIPTNTIAQNNYFGISKVTLNAISNSTSGAAEGYHDYTCNQQASLAQLNSYTLEVQTRVAPQTNNYYENVLAWIDFNNDTNFASDELVLNSKYQQGTHTATVTPKMNAVINQPLRMRVVNVFSTALTFPLTTSCNLYALGEAEDYTVTIIPYTNVPASSFTQDSRIACGSPIQFRDTSTFFPTSWQWNFGDPASGASNTSTLKNPSHSFSGTGPYTVSLTACNNNGCSTVAKSNYVTVPSNITLAPVSCKPQTVNNKFDRGIKDVFYSGVINNTTGNASVGYQDYSCSQNGIVKFHIKQWLSVTTFNNYENVKAWLDYNNDGNFTQDELIMDSQGGGSVEFKLPATVVKNTYIRLRIISDDSSFPISGPCNDVQQGQAEDYAIKVITPPDGEFVHTFNCNGITSFTDQSSFSPTSWNWDFGDPASGTQNASTLKNPTHTYNAPGAYYTSLNVCNSFGCTSKVQLVYIDFNSNINLPATCHPKMIGFATGGILNFTLLNINNTTQGATEGYRDYSCTKNVVVSPGATCWFTAKAGKTLNENFQVWVDYDNNGAFSAQERVFVSMNNKNHSGNFVIPPTAVKNTYLRLRINSELATKPLPSACSDLEEGQAEDYAIKISGPNGISGDYFAQQVKVYPNPSNGIFSLEMPSVLKGEFQLEVQDLAGKTVAKQAIKVTDTQSQQISFNQLAKGIYLIRISNSEISTIKKIIIE